MEVHTCGELRAALQDEGVDRVLLAPRAAHGGWNCTAADLPQHSVEIGSGRHVVLEGQGPGMVYYDVGAALGGAGLACRRRGGLMPRDRRRPPPARSTAGSGAALGGLVARRCCPCTVCTRLHAQLPCLRCAALHTRRPTGSTTRSWWAPAPA